ncbi:hypothetical protein E2C01_008661 [Portunus trituberculatus]|uniref:Uncharacterized protein n=1 Tax=Portunus trituberculatus TaxID=210409 RepID=A0A5B7D4Z2_PORTR|nr:hypothetical protein [Portunus trituberculatus]
MFVRRAVAGATDGDMVAEIEKQQEDNQYAMANINRQQKTAEEWTKMWQVTFALDKTHTMVISWFPASSCNMDG